MNDLNEEVEEREDEKAEAFSEEIVIEDLKADDEAANGIVGAEAALPAEKEEKTNFFSELIGWMSALLFAMAAVLAINLFFLRSITVSGASMNDTLVDKDKVFAMNFFYTPKRGDIVIVQADKLKLKGTDLYGETIIKRVIGVAGDKIRIDFGNGIVYLNDEVLEEDYIREPVHDRYHGWIDSNVDYVVPENCVFVMGDNRNVSNDSRNIKDVGFIDTDYIMGKAIVRYVPLGNMKWL